MCLLHFLFVVSKSLLGVSEKGERRVPPICGVEEPLRSIFILLEALLL